MSTTASTPEALTVARKLVASVDDIMPPSPEGPIELIVLTRQVGLLSAAVLALAEAIEHQGRP